MTAWGDDKINGQAARAGAPRTQGDNEIDKNNQTLEPKPIDLRDAHHRVRRFWSWALLSPIIYLVLAWLMDHWGWVLTIPGAPHPYDKPWVHALLGAAGAVSLLGIVWLRVRHDPSGLAGVRRDDDAFVRRWVARFFKMAVLADVLGFLGLVYFMISGRAWALLAGGVAAYVGYALAYPRWRDLDPLHRLDR